MFTGFTVSLVSFLPSFLWLFPSGVDWNGVTWGFPPNLCFWSLGTGGPLAVTVLSSWDLGEVGWEPQLAGALVTSVYSEL